ncbi:MAG: M20 family metallopeptidase [Anaerolineae bacterium]
MADLLSYCHDHLDDMLDLLAALVAHETPSSDKAALDRLGGYVAGLCRDLGAAVTVEPRAAAGDLVLAKWHDGAPGKPIVAVMHMDTVWPLGTLAQRPLRREGDRLYGPGVFDMKGGIAAVLSAVKALQALDHFPRRPVWALFTTDEETGSHHSADYLRAVAQEAGLVLVPELPTPDEGLKTARKGVGAFYVTAHGKSAHAGNEPEKGVNAVVEIARQVEAIAALSDFERGTTVTPTVIQGGAATNVVPDEATLAVDVRASRAEERARVERAMAGLAPTLPGASLDVRGGFNRPPMVRDSVMIATFQQAAAIAARVGLPPLTEGSAGGGSDGNFTAALGVPTLDGLGPAGAGAHAAHEHILVPGLARRAALIAGILLYWPQ